MPGFLKIAVYVTLIIIVFFLIRKKEPKPSQLEMGLSKYRKKTNNKNALKGVRKVQAQVVTDTEKDHSDIIFFEGNPYNIWEILGVPSGASQDEIKRAFAHKSTEAGANKALLLKAYKKAVSQI